MDAKVYGRETVMGEVIKFPSERNREHIRSQLLLAAKLLIQIEDLQSQRTAVLRDIGMIKTEDKEDLW
jgi:hypothetical protein